LARQLKKSGARTVDVDSAQWITDDMVRLNVSRESTVGEAVNELLMSGTALDAQPNYLYSVDDSMTPGQIALCAMQEKGAVDDASNLFEDGSKGDIATDAATAGVLTDQDDTGEDGSMTLAEGPEGLDAVDGEGHESSDGADHGSGAGEDNGADDIDGHGSSDNAGSVDDGVAPRVGDAPEAGAAPGAKRTSDDKDAVELVDDEGIVVGADDDASTEDVVVVDETVGPDAEAGATAQASTVTDPFFVKGFQWGLKSIRAPEVWAQESTASMQKVGVAVLDCGFDVTHPDIKNMIAPGSAYNAYRASVNKEDENGIYTYTDDQLADVASGSSSPIPGVGHYDHGMHVSGVIAAQRNNFEGIAGVADNVQLVPVRIYDYSDTTPQAPLSAIIKGMDYAIKTRTRIIYVLSTFLWARAGRRPSAQATRCARR
jgi:hypothetical protein